VAIRGPIRGIDVPVIDVDVVLVVRGDGVADVVQFVFGSGRGH